MSWYLHSGLVGLYSGFSWSIASLFPFAVITATLHGPFVTALTSLSLRMRNWRGVHNVLPPQQRPLLIQGEAPHAVTAFSKASRTGVATAHSTSPWEIPAGEPGFHPAHSSYAASLSPSLTVSLLSAYLCARLAHGLTYPLETIR